ncbi:Oidioi.mRNA.OKI2018_I69.PAR.g11526.t1.cds [Oikopleura dioica]|uniref:protein-tyrosine-phosphatase n=1 Tax=Oikopleura dioica TaxID=34765 RepID=A0ABN7RZ23_OIKDI|nr:Oidioi.mRNA.OKI2018_I69.PAR.g11526.t1.cds [Oikopleura dioica]
MAKDVSVTCNTNPFYNKLSKCVIDDCTSRRCIETTCNVRSDGSLDGPEDCQILTDLRYNKLLPKELQDPVMKYQNKRDYYESSADFDYDCLYESDDEELNTNCRKLVQPERPTAVLVHTTTPCSWLDLLILTIGSCLGFISIIMLILCYFKCKGLYCFAPDISTAELEKQFITSHATENYLLFPSFNASNSPPFTLCNNECTKTSNKQENRRDRRKRMITLTPVAKRLQLSNVSDTSTDDVFDAMDVDSPAGARSRSPSSPFMSPLALRSAENSNTEPIEPPAGSSPTVGLKRHGFLVIRKRRSTFNDRLAIRKKRTSSPLRPLNRPTTPDDYILKEDNLCSTDDAGMDSLMSAPIIKRPTGRNILRRKSALPLDNTSSSPISVRPQRTMSLCSPAFREIRMRTNSLGEHQIPTASAEALNPLMDNQNMPGDQLALPLTTVGKHSDLRYISTETMANLLDEKFSIDYEVIDARYPYEFNGGHIKGARNLFTKDMINEAFFGENTPPVEEGSKKKILVFHCEFSSERAPSMMKHLRKRDRAKNRYPKLDYPEIYVLKGVIRHFTSVRK